MTGTDTHAPSSAAPAARGGVPDIAWLPSPTLVVDSGGACLQVSDSACDLLAVSTEVLLGDGWVGFFDNADETMRWMTSMAGMAGAKDGAASMDLTSGSRPGRSFQIEFRNVPGHEGILFACLKETTSERQAVTRLASYKTILNQIQTISSTGYWNYDVSSGQVLWSDGVFDIHGFERGPQGISIEEAIDVYHPDDRQCVRDHISQSLATGDPFEFELRVVRDDGSIRYVVSRGEVENAGNPDTARLFGVFQDVTEEREEALAKQATQERLRMVVEASGEGLWDWGYGADRIFMSERLKEILGITDAGSMIDTDHVRSFIHPDHRKEFYAPINRSFETGDRCVGEVRIRRADGSDGWVEVKAVASFNADGKPGRVVCAVGDITERRAAEEELRLARAEAEQSDEAKSNFVATVSHELRTPLNGIIGMLDLLTQAKLSSDQQPLADIASDSARGLLAILDDLLDLSKLGANRLELNPVPFRPHDMIEGIIRLFAPVAAQRDMGIVLNVDSSVPEVIGADKVRLRQIVSNLISNALKFTDSGTVNVYVSRVSGPNGQDQLRCAVQDTGIGIAKSAQADLFEPYAQASGSTFGEFGGTGLGLAICKQLSERMGGQIGVESEPGAGSTFWFTIDYAKADAAQDKADTAVEAASASGSVPGQPPAARPDRPGGTPAETASGDPSPDPSPDPSSDTGRRDNRASADSGKKAKGHLLIAEDNAVNQRVITAMVTRLGYSFDMVEDGAQAVEAARATHYDAILMDVQMPNIDGIMATRLIREEERDLDRDVPIIAITAHAMRGTREDLLAAGMSDFVPKPISVKELAVSLHKLCQKGPKDSEEQKSTAFAAGGA